MSIDMKNEIEFIQNKIYVLRNQRVMLDFDLAKIINSIPLKDFIKIYILIYLEIELLFFSSELEKLNMFMFALYILNYPLTDSNYFWHIETISEKDLKLDINSVSSGFKGINTKYSSNLDLSKIESPRNDSESISTNSKMILSPKAI